MIPVKVDQLLLSSKGPVVLLKSDKDPRTLPIFIGGAEAQSIHIHLSNMKIPRPLTHDLFKSFMDMLECRLMKVEVSELKEGTFYAVIHCEHDGSSIKIDSRPSDAIALAMRFSAPIFVADAVMDEAGQMFEEMMSQKEETARPEQKIKLSTLQRLKQDLETAVKEERFEDASRIRDEIKKLEKGHSGN